MAAEKEGQSALDLFPETLINAEGKEVTRDSLKGKTLGIYFSAHWCPPCKVFTPKLVAFRNANKDKFEIVFVSSDKDEKAQLGYMKEAGMKWPAVKYATKEIGELKKKYAIRGIPTLVIVDEKGETVSMNGRGDVTSSPDKALAKWTAAK